MQAHENNLEVLAQRVQQGDRHAKAKFQQSVEPSLVRIVRRVLEKGHATSSLERKILVAAERLAPQTVPSSNDPRTTPLAHNLCEMVVSRLWPGATEERWHATVLA